LNVPGSFVQRLYVRVGREQLFLPLVAALFAGCFYFSDPDLTKTVDYVLFYRPNFHFFAGALSAGHLPWWNPYAGLGRPFIADMQTAVLYPPAYLLLSGGKFVLFLFVWLHSLLAMVGMARLCGTLRFNAPARRFCAVAFMAMAPVSARWFTGQLFYAAGICYLPLLFHLAIGLTQSPRAELLFGYSLTLALQFLCGHPQVWWISILGQGAFLLSRVALVRNWPEFRLASRYLVLFALVLLWSVALVAIVLLPFLQLVQNGNRAGATSELSASGSMAWSDFISLIAVGSRHEINWEKNLYVGLPVLLAGIAGFACARDRNGRAMVGVLLIGLLVSMANHLPTFTFFSHVLPGFAQFRIHSRAGLLICFSLVLGAGIIISNPPRWLVSLWGKAFGYPMKFLMAGFSVATGLSLLVMLVSNKRSYGPDTTGGGGTGYPFQATLSSKIQELAGPMGSVPPRALVPSFLVPPNAGMEMRYRSPDAYTSLFLKRPWQYLHRSLGLTPSEQMNSFLPLEIFERGPFPYTNMDSVIGYDLQAQALVVNSNSFSTALLVYGERVISDSDDLWSVLKTNDLRNVAVVEQSSGGQSKESNLAGEAARIVRYSENDLDVSFPGETKDAGVLVLDEAWYPGWKCEVGSQITRAIPVNGWMRGFRIPKGSQNARIYFEQEYFLRGAAISGVALLVGVAAIIVRKFKATADSGNAEGSE